MIGLQSKSEEEACLNEHRARFAKFGLKVEEDKTRLIEFRRRLQRSNWTWDRMYRLMERHLPKLKIQHPYPDQRFRVRLKVGAV